MGAEIIEKHVTLDTNMKGTDHKGSADMITFHTMLHDIRSVEFSMGTRDLFIDDSVSAAKEKLERSLAFKTNLNAGEVVKMQHLHMISPGSGYKWKDLDMFIGKKTKNKINANTLLDEGLLVT